MYKRKTRDLYILQGRYCDDFEDVTYSTTLKEAKQDLKDYVENVKGVSFRIIKKREVLKK